MKTLRPYQAKAVQECWEAVEEGEVPVLLMASVGAGKSLMLADLLLTIQKRDGKALCIVNNSELVRNNCETFIEQGGIASIYCAALGRKDSSESIIFGTPQSILNGIKKNERISNIKFEFIVIDEVHNVNFNLKRSNFMRIIDFYHLQRQDITIIGATGTNFRYKGESIVGDGKLFKKQVGNITTERLIDQNYLIKPVFEIDEDLVIDFSKVKIKSGRFDAKELEQVVSESPRLTELICKQIIKVMETQNRFGVFIFATTKRHAHEIMTHLPTGEAALVLGETETEERTRIFNEARIGKIKYLVNISIISVGVDIPAFDTIAYMRPTESLVLIVQTMGRALRLSPKTGKDNALIMDFAGNIERHRDWDNPILIDAVRSLDKDKEYVIDCPACEASNTEHARRCIGVANDKRCDYYFEFKDCPSCESRNDITARYCHNCSYELIDPNDKLSLMSGRKTIRAYVNEARYGISGTISSFAIHAAYSTDLNEIIYERYQLSSDKARRFFYATFVKQHCELPSVWYMNLDNKFKMQQMLKEMKSPIALELKVENNKFKIKSKIFQTEDNQL
jgi:DNA repair protein RadD